MAKKKNNRKISNQLNLDIGADLFMQFKDVKEYFPSYLIGLKPDAFIIIKTPNVFGKEFRFAKGKKIILKYKQLGEVFKFKASVIGSLDKPFKITFISYPRRIEKIEFRNSPRVYCAIPASLLFRDNEAKGVITDISVGGCKLKLKDINIFDDIVLIKPDEEIRLNLSLLGLKRKKEFRGMIKKIGVDDNIALSIGFKKISAEFRDMIAAYVKTTSE